MYSITEAHIERNKLFLLNEIEEISYRPDSPFQVLMGDNGSGKSTLMRLLTAYDPDANEFHKGGAVRLHLDAEGTKYEVGYDINGSIRYTFKVDGVEMNEGGTREVYRSLWAEELGVTQTTIALLTNRYRLTEMRPPERQALFSTVTGVDMTYGFTVFDKLKRRANGVKGAIKEDKVLLAKLIAQRINDDEVEVLQSRVEDYRNRANRYLQAYRNDIEAVDPEEIKRLLATHKVRTVALRELLKRTVIPVGQSSEAEANLELRELEANLTHMTQWRNDLLKQFTELDDMHQRLQATVGSANTDEERQELVKTIRDATTQPYYRPEFHYDDPTTALNQLMRILPEWQQLVTEFNGGIAPKDAIDQCLALEERQRTVLRGIGQVEANIEAQKTHLQHLKSHTDEHCPKCGYSAAGELRANAITKAEATITELSGRLHTGYALRDEVTAELARLTEYRNTVQRILAPEHQYPLLANYFATIFAETYLFDNPSHLTGISNNLLLDLKAKVAIRKAETRLAEIDAIVRQLQDQQIGSMVALVQQIERTRERYEQYVEGVAKLEVHLANVRATMSAAGAYYQELSHVVGYIEHLHEDALRYAIDGMFNNMCIAAYTDYDEAAKVIEDQLRNIDQIEARIKGTQDHLAEMERKQEGLAVLMDAMSPATGLLAKCAIRPVEHFINQMNLIIERVWTHELKMLPYKPRDHVRMDYVFPMSVAGRDTLVPDINRASDGQAEIINFAFIIVALMRIGNRGIPLMLDETDRPLQPEHKENLMVFLREMVESGWFSQIFVISHHVSAYSALPQADIIELRPRSSHPGANRVINFK